MVMAMAMADGACGVGKVLEVSTGPGMPTKLGY